MISKNGLFLDMTYSWIAPPYGSLNLGFYCTTLG